jgi:hypothetical protein
MSLPTINCFIKFAPEFFNHNLENLQKLFEIAKRVMNNTAEPIVLENNVEGILIFQMMF